MVRIRSARAGAVVPGDAVRYRRHVKAEVDGRGWESRLSSCATSSSTRASRKLDVRVQIDAWIAAGRTIAEVQGHRLAGYRGLETSTCSKDLATEAVPSVQPLQTTMT